MTADNALFNLIDGRPHYRGLPVQQHTTTIDNRVYIIDALRDAADLLDQPDYAKRFVEDDVAPYGMELWPAARMLSEYVVAEGSGGDQTAIELGCGLGLVSIVAAAHGWHVVATDHEQSSLAFARHNADQNNAQVARFEVVDWHQPDAAVTAVQTPPGFDRVLAADVLYQASDHGPVARCIDRLLAPEGVALIADPNRGVADRFARTAADHGFGVAIENARAPSTSSAGGTVEGRIFVLRKSKN